MTAGTIPRDVCIVLLSGLGDVVHGLPVVNALKRANPECRITWVVEPMPAQILSPHPSVDEVVIYRKRAGLNGVRDLWEKMRGRRFDLTLNLNYLAKSVWATLFSRAPRRIGFERGRSPEGVWLAVNEHLRPGSRGHTQDMFLEFLAYLDVPAHPLEWAIRFTESERGAQRQFLESLGGRPLAAVVPASANPRKDWLPERYAAVVDALDRDFGFRVVLVGGPGEREGRLARQIMRCASIHPLWGLGDGVRRVAWMIDAAQLVIAPDTGPVHIARALEVPVIALYGHTNPWRVGPYRRFQDLWVDRYTEPGQAPNPADADPRMNRMEQITIPDVLERVERAIRRYPSRETTR